jgi:hypothetical protein
MKKTLSLVLATLLAMTALVSCANQDADTTTTAPAATTTTVGTTTTKQPPVIIPDPDPGVSDEPVDENDYLFPNAKAGDLALRVTEVSGFGVYEGEGTSDSGNYMAIVNNDTMSSGKITAVFTGLEGSGANDNGIVFGMEDFEDGSFFWEDGPSYYFLFVSDRGSLYLSKVSYNGSPWNVCVDTAETIEGYVHGDQVTISVEWDGAGNIKCYANDTLMIEYADADPLVGTNYGVRCEVAGVVYHSVVAEHN